MDLFYIKTMNISLNNELTENCESRRDMMQKSMRGEVQKLSLRLGLGW